MKKILTAFVMAAVFCCMLSQARAEILEEQRHRDWNSFILTTPEGGMARMTTMDSGTMLAIDMVPGGGYFIRLLEYLPDVESGAYDVLDGVTLPGKMRVDRRRMYDVRFMFHVRGDTLVVGLAGEFNETLLQEARRGAVLRMKVGMEEPIFASFSLMGFSAALDRCMRLTRILESLDPPDSDYFDEPAPDTREFHNGRGSDGTYFL